MAELEFAGVKFKGGKIVIILTALSTLAGGLWGGFEFYKDYLDMKTKIQEYTAPDLTYLEKEIAIIKSELDSVLAEITIVADVAKDLKNDMKADLRSMNGDIRHITEIVNDVEDRQKEDTREIFDELKLIEDNLNLEINKALNNPLSALTNK